MPRGFKKGQISLGDFDTQDEASEYRFGSKLGKLWSGQTMKPYRDQGYTLGVTRVYGRWHVVLNPPGVSSY